MVEEEDAEEEDTEEEDVVVEEEDVVVEEEDMVVEEEDMVKEDLTGAIMMPLLIIVILQTIIIKKFDSANY